LTYEEDLKEMLRAKSLNPDLRVGIIDPRGSNIKSYVEASDFLVIDSLEMSDFFVKFGKPMFRYFEYPDAPKIRKEHKDKKKIIIGYHGNKLHLQSMYPHVTTALEVLSNNYDIEFWVVYNVKTLGKWKFATPKNVKIRHIQWHEKVYEEDLAEVDIGLVPSMMPITENDRRNASKNSYFNENRDDYILRFKMPSNPGRMIIFWKLGIPVVADFLPSHLEFIRDGRNGLLAQSSAGWYHAIKKLIDCHKLRQKISNEALLDFEKYFCHKEQNKNFMKFIEHFPLMKQDCYPSLSRSFKDETYMKNAKYFEKFEIIKSKIFKYVKS
jgi:glycosyltransferase involved in cell wall biosynthesis